MSARVDKRALISVEDLNPNEGSLVSCAESLSKRTRRISHPPVKAWLIGFAVLCVFHTRSAQGQAPFTKAKRSR
jgi:hypothetical protein